MIFLKYLIHYKENKNELEELTKKYDDARSDIYNSNKQIKELKEKNKFLEERINKHLETIKTKNKQIRDLKKRDVKLKQIEEMFESKRVVLRDLKTLIKEEK